MDIAPKTVLKGLTGMMGIPMFWLSGIDHRNRGTCKNETQLSKIIESLILFK